jgi:hypothetical protein
MSRRQGVVRWGLGLFAFSSLAAACGQGNYTAAGVALGASVTGAGVNRAITGDCWAVCSPGYGCDRQRGTCVRAECAPGCTPDQHCVIEADGRTRCIDNPGALSLGAAPRDAGSD